MFKQIITLLKFLTRIPFPIDVEFDEKMFARSIVFAPLVGCLVGLIMAGVYFGFSLLGVRVVAIAAAVISGIFLTGGLHLDGLADTADGIFSNSSREKMLEIMQDPRIGTNGVLALVIVTGMKFLLLMSISEEHILQLLMVMPVIARMNIVWCSGISAYAREGGGMGRSIVENTGIKEIVIATFISLLLSGLIFYDSNLLLPLAACVLSVIFAIAFSRYVKKKINGITGDIIGAVIELTEVAVLFTFLVVEILIVKRIIVL